ncbi:Bromodomain containing protein [Trichomonas vaginalis G3]|uniref:Bromodomain containing protein n=1 Tax=Trichomonas vaginalis (strain ATCC PRA-98 / G3) TaxID=412133 RepID=A2FQI2_TRIV3|nr:bromodomain family [Trichomonas vaginalis G3]EAX92843.1 Bromodomain containing protein [Trichomonas vaginalis G3]KAI5499405.1 bromodomain family [Trichomonas vaginalis G3]|eukprot:XP_001305773.1 Bromodomain containing protein [Trichomonas vaginalis G3]
MEEENWSKCFEIMKNLLEAPCTGPFRLIKEETIPHYTELIKNPQDLYRIYHRLEKREYQSTKRWKEEVNLVWDNAIKFNGENDYGKLAHYAKLYFKKLYDEKFARIEKIAERAAELERKIDSLLSDPPRNFPALRTLFSLKPKSETRQNDLINEIFHNIIRFTDADSQRKMFTLLRMYNPELGDNPIVSEKNPDLRVTVSLDSLPIKTLEALKEFISNNMSQ